MSTYLYLWNPDKWHWSDLQDAICRVNNNKIYDVYWSCGGTKKISVGDKFILQRLGKEPKGIIGCGYVTSEPYKLPHWDEEAAAKGEAKLRTDLLFKALSEKPLIPLTALKERFADYKWTPQIGGLSIPDNIADQLWSEIHVSTAFSTQSESEIRLYSEGKVKSVSYKTYDRSPEARRACIEHHGYNCSVCGFSFEQTYGEIGKDYIEVHHLRQVADIGEEYEINPIEDLRPVCANCHRMLHKTRPPLAIEELKIKIETCFGKAQK